MSFFIMDSNDPDQKAYTKKMNGVLSPKKDALQQVVNSATGGQDKRIKISKDTDAYDIYIMAQELGSNHPNTILAFFCALSKDFSSHHELTRFWSDFRTTFTQQFDATDVLACTGPNSKPGKKATPILADIARRYGSSALSSAQQKVNDIKIVMTDNIDRAMANSANMDDLEAKSQALSDSSGRYVTKAKKAQRDACLENYKTKCICALVVLVVLGVVAGIIAAIV